MYDYKMYNKKLVRSIRRHAEIADEVISDETIADSLSYEQILDLEQEILFHGTPSFKDNFVDIYNELVRGVKA